MSSKAARRKKRLPKSQVAPSTSTPSSIAKVPLIHTSSPLSNNNSPSKSALTLKSKAGRPVPVNDAMFRTIKTSPIRHNSSLPSPSPESHNTFDSVNVFNPISKSSPIKKKKVVFADRLIHRVIADEESSPLTANIPQPQTPFKSILKLNATAQPSLQPLSQTTNFSLSPQSNAKLSPAKYEFWSPGNIPRIISSRNAQDELVSFKALIIGGLTVLNLQNCDRQFEIYATLNLLLKDITEKKLEILAPFLADLVNAMQNYLIEMNDDIIKMKNPFSIRTAVQIIKIFTGLLSNTKLFTTHWRKGNNFEVASWCLSYASSMILNSTISKSLLSANLQLLKEQRVHARVPMKQQETILYAVINMKQLNSTSVLTERLLTIKSLVSSFTVMMEKNIKSWIKLLFNCLCDFTSPFYQKSLASASLLLLETAKQFLTSKAVNFEFTALLESPISKSLNIDVSQHSFDSTPLDTTQTVFHYLTERLIELLDQEGSSSTTLAMDTWLGITLSYFNTPSNLKHLTERWMLVIEKSIQKVDIESKVIAIRSWRAFIYIYCNENEVSPEGLKTIFKIFTLLAPLEQSLPPTVYSRALLNLISQICYVFFNNKRFDSKLDDIWKDWIYPYVYEWLFKNDLVETYGAQVFTHLITGRPNKELNEFYLMKTISNEAVNIKDIECFGFEFALNNHADLYDIFLKRFWMNEKTPLRVKLNILNSLLVKLKFALASKKYMSLPTSPMKVNTAFGCYEDFVGVYVKGLDKLHDSLAKIEYLTKLANSLKTNFGTKLFFQYNQDGQTIFKLDNCYVKLVGECLKYDVKTTDVLKYLVSQNKAYEYKILEGVVMFFKHELSLMNFITNNLESKIFTNIFAFELNSIIFIVKNLPSKSSILLENILTLFLKFEEKKTTFSQLQPLTWGMESLFTLLNVINPTEISVLSFYKPFMLDIIISKLKEKDEQFTKDFFNSLLKTASTQLWLLEELKEYLFYHVVDPSNAYSDATHLEMTVFFDKYIKVIQKISASLFDATVSHGLTVAGSLKESGNYTMRIIELERILYLSLQNVNWRVMVKVKEYLDDRRKKDAELFSHTPSPRRIINHALVSEAIKSSKPTPAIEIPKFTGKSPKPNVDAEDIIETAPIFPRSDEEENQINEGFGTAPTQIIEVSQSTSQDLVPDAPIAEPITVPVLEVATPAEPISIRPASKTLPAAETAESIANLNESSEEVTSIQPKDIPNSTDLVIVTEELPQLKPCTAANNVSHPDDSIDGEKSTLVITEESEEIDSSKSKISETDEEDPIEEDNGVQAQSSIEEVNESSGEDIIQQVPDSVGDKDTLVIVNEENQTDSFDVIDSSIESNKALHNQEASKVIEVEKTVIVQEDSGLKDTQVISATLRSVQLVPLSDHITETEDEYESCPSNVPSPLKLVAPHCTGSINQPASRELIESPVVSKELIESSVGSGGLIQSHAASKELIESPVIESTQEVADSKSPFNPNYGKPPVDLIESLELVRRRNTGYNDFGGNFDAGDIPSDILSLELDSSPIKTRVSSSLSLTRTMKKISLPEVTVGTSSDDEDGQGQILHERRMITARSHESDDEEDEDEIRIIDGAEFSQSVDKSVERKRPYSPDEPESPSKRFHSDDIPSSYYSPQPNVKQITAPVKDVVISQDTSVGALSSLNDFSGFIDSVSNEDLSALSDKEAFDLETKLMKFMLRVRESRSN